MEEKDNQPIVEWLCEMTYPITAPASTCTCASVCPIMNNGRRGAVFSASDLLGGSSIPT